MRFARLACLVVLAAFSAAVPARGERVPASPSLFDPARHMRVSEVRSGMTGYGLSVFHGTRIERFDVEVISVLKNFNPKYDVVLIRCHGANLEHTGAIAGMSGSPIFLRDGHGRERMIGAFAYGWPLMKDPIAGVQPIEYMLEVGATLKPQISTTRESGDGLGDALRSGGKGLYTIDPLRADRMFLPPRRRLPAAGQSAGRLTGGAEVPQLKPLATPLMAAGIGPAVLEQFGPLLQSYGLVPLQAGGIGGSSACTQPAPELVPGGVLAAPMLTGDIELTAIGTCTEVIGDRVFGFGHPFQNEGPITLPMGSGQINGIISSLAQSFKLGAMSQLRGTLIADQSVGVAGTLGAAPATIPIDVRIVYSDGSQDVSYHFDCAAHPRLTPMLAGLGIAAAVSGRRELPQYHTLNYDVSLEFANGKSVQLRDVAVNTSGSALLYELGLPIMAAADNPFERVMLTKATATIRVTPEARQADILSVMLPKLKYKPGETLKAFVTYRPFRAREAILPVELQLPHDLRDGTYQLQIADWENYIREEQTARPFRFSAESIDDVFAVLKEVGGIRHNAVYVRLLRQADGVALGRTAMPLLPSSRRQVMLEAGRSDTTPFVSAAVKIVPTDLLMTGSADFEIEISADEHVEVGPGGKGSKPAAEPRVSPQPSGEGGKPRSSPKAEPPTSGEPKTD